MPELPDIAAYLDALEARIVGQPLQRIRLASAFLLRTGATTARQCGGPPGAGTTPIGKRIAIGLEGDLWLVLHLMIAGRLHWRTPERNRFGGQSLAAFRLS